MGPLRPSALCWLYRSPVREPRAETTGPLGGQTLVLCLVSHDVALPWGKPGRGLPRQERLPPGEYAGPPANLDVAPGLLQCLGTVWAATCTPVTG